MKQKLALCIGINDYPGTDSDLTGCVNDALAWGEVLKQRGFSVQTLLNSDATGLAMTEYMGAVVDAVGWGDIGVITFSGHGSWVPDVSGDEPDYRDEGLVPHDVQQYGLITDDTLHDLFAERRHGGRLIMLSDSCHSGTVNRLAGPVMGGRPRVRYLPPQTHLNRDGLSLARAVERAPSRGKPRPTALLMAACADTEYAYDGYGAHRMGAFTVVALNALTKLYEGATYRDWMREIRKLLPAVDVPQTPQLFGTRTQLDWPVFEPVRSAG